MTTTFIALPDLNFSVNSVSVRDLILDTLHDPRFGIDLASLRIAGEIARLMTDKDAKKPELSAPAFQLLVSVLEKPTRGYDPKVAIPLLPLFEAVVSAQTKV